MDSIQFVQYGEAQHAGVHIIYWQTFSGSKHWFSLPLEWYSDGKHPIDALREYAPAFRVTGYTEFEHMERMYSVPKRGKCEGRFERIGED